MFVVGMELMESSWVQIGLEDYNPRRLEYQVEDYHKNARKHLFELRVMEPSWVQIGLEDYNPRRLEYQVEDYHKNARKHLLELRVLDFIVCQSIANNG